MGLPYREHIEYPALTMAQMIERIAAECPNEAAYEFYGRRTSYQKFVEEIETAARAFLALGIERDDRVTICLPNVPQALACFYGLNRIGAAANMVHPQSAQEEITFYLNVSKSKAVVTLDMFAEKVEAIERQKALVQLSIEETQTMFDFTMDKYFG